MIILQIEEAKISLPDFEKEWKAIEHHYFEDSLDSKQIAVDLAIELNAFYEFKGCDCKFRARVCKWTKQADNTFIAEVLI